MERADRLQAMEVAVERLREAAENATVVVEGARDVAALARLGIGGSHFQVHRGRPISDLIELLAHSTPPVILLLDWDRTGGRLVKTLEEALRGRVLLDLDCRRRLISCCHARCLEDVPAELTSLRANS